MIPFFARIVVSPSYTGLGERVWAIATANSPAITTIAMVTAMNFIVCADITLDGETMQGKTPTYLIAASRIYPG